MQVELRQNSIGNYRFHGLEGRPFSAGVVVDDAFDLIHVTFTRPLPIARGIAAAADYVVNAGRPVPSIAAFELRIAQPLSRADFSRFNEEYVALLLGIGLDIAGVIPAARTNVAPTIGRVGEPSVYAFSFTMPGSHGKPAYVLSGVPEEVQGEPREMLRNIARTLAARAGELGCSLTDATTIQLYGVGALDPSDLDGVASEFGDAITNGIRWFPSLPPIEGLRFEIDARSAGIRQLLTLSGGVSEANDSNRSHSA